MSDAALPPLRFYVFYFDSTLEGEHTYRTVLDNEVPHRLQKFQESAYAGAMSLSRGWGKLYIPEFELERFMELTGNALAPEPEMHVDNSLEPGKGCVPALFLLVGGGFLAGLLG